MKSKHPVLALCATLALSAAGLAHAEPVSYKIDPTHTFASFEISHFNASVIRGRFDRKEGTITLDRAAGTGKIDISIDPASASTGVPGLDKHMQNADLFDVTAHPTARFESTALKFDGDKLTEVQGRLTLKGKTHPVTLSARQFGCYDHPMLKREVCGGDFEATIDRTLWDLGYGTQMGMTKDVRLLITAEGVRQ